MCAQDPGRRVEEKGLQCGHPPRGMIFHFPSLCLSPVHEPYGKRSLKDKQTKTPKIYPEMCFSFLLKELLFRELYAVYFHKSLHQTRDMCPLEVCVFIYISA